MPKLPDMTNYRGFRFGVQGTGRWITSYMSPALSVTPTVAILEDAISFASFPFETKALVP